MMQIKCFCDRCKKDMGDDAFKRTDMIVPVPPPKVGGWMLSNMWPWKRKEIALCRDCHERLLEFLGVNEQ